MKIGVFDSGLGGLIITDALAKNLPQYDYIYLGDTARVPYGNRSQEAIYHFTQEAIDHLYAKDCAVVITACNTVSVEALRKIRKFDIPNNYPDRHAFGVVLPTVHAVISQNHKKVGVIGTAATINSHAYQKVFNHIDPTMKVYEQATPLLVPLIENNGTEWAQPIITQYLLPLIKANVDAIILGCTHYAYFKDIIQKILGHDVSIYSQDEIIPQALNKFLAEQPQVAESLSTNNSVEYLVTDINDSFKSIAHHILEHQINLRKAVIAKGL